VFGHHRTTVSPGEAREIRLFDIIIGLDISNHFC
jgi:hypothetical protein